MNKLKLILGIAILAMLGLGATHAPVISQDEGELRWYTIEEVAKIKAENPNDDKAIFVDVYTDWCGWCKRMDATTFRDKKVQEILGQEFYPVKFDGEAKREIELGGITYKYVPSGRRGYHELAAALLQGKLSYPTVVLLDAQFNMIQPIPGYRTAKDLLPILHFIGTEAYQTESWEVFSHNWKSR